MSARDGQNISIYIKTHTICRNKKRSVLYMEFYLFNRNWKEIPAHEILERLESSEEWVLRDIPRIVYREYVEKEVLAAGYHKTDNVFFGVFEMYENARKDSFFLIPKKDITREDAETLQSFLPGVVFYGE